MIVSKPAVSALISLGIFVLIAINLGGYNAYIILTKEPYWYNYTLVAIFLPLGLGILIKQILTYKVITLGQAQLTVRYPWLFKFHRVSLNTMEFWEETVIKTKSGVFKQAMLKFEKITVKLTIQENTNYVQVINYLKKKASRKQKK